MYLVYSAFPTTAIALPATTTVSVFGFKFQCFSCSFIADYLHRAEYINDSLTLVANGPYQAHNWWEGRGQVMQLPQVAKWAAKCIF
jgi:hypothetical protein